MISPRPLLPGDKVAIVATARRVTEEQISPAIAELERWGLQVVLSPKLFSGGHSYLAGADAERIAAFQQVVDDPEIAAIICARGGYGSTRIIDQVDFRRFMQNPKWIVGFSDVTAIHLKLSSLGVESIHGTMPVLFAQPDASASIEHLRRTLFGELLELTGPALSHNRFGSSKGRLIGGNLSLLVDALGTSLSPNTDGAILVIEEIDEYLYKIDRMLVQLKRAGKLSRLAGLVAGHFTQCKESEFKFGETVEEIVRYHTSDYPYPVAFGLPTGHENPNLSWIVGREASLEVKKEGVALKHSRSANEV